MRTAMWLAVLLCGAVWAQRTLSAPDVSVPDPLRPGVVVQGGEIQVTAATDGPGSTYLQGGAVDAPLASLVLSRSLVDAIAGNLDKESLERAHHENR